MTEQPSTLAALPQGHSAQVTEMRLTDSLSRRLRALGLIPGTLVTCVHAGHGIAAYRIRGAVIALRDCDAAGVLIE